MFIIKEIEGVSADSLPIYPLVDEDDYLHNFHDSDIASCVSTLGVESIIGNCKFRMGDSSKMFAVSSTGIKGPEAMPILKRFAEDFVSLAEAAISEMSDDYRCFYEHMIDDFKTNGVVMPIYGKL